ncbi:MAG: hypothetical protein R6V40_01620 [Candidatus Moraniibacteriota bacterium]
MDNIPSVCVVCQKAKRDVKHSLPLEKKEGKWKTNPVCPGCRRTLIGQAKAEGRYIKFYPMEASVKEAERRNKQSEINRPFLDRFAQKGKPKPKQKGSGSKEPAQTAKVVKFGR